MATATATPAPRPSTKRRHSFLADDAHPHPSLHPRKRRRTSSPPSPRLQRCPSAPLHDTCSPLRHSSLPGQSSAPITRPPSSASTAPSLRQTPRLSTPNTSTSSSPSPPSLMDAFSPTPSEVVPRPQDITSPTATILPTKTSSPTPTLATTSSPATPRSLKPPTPTNPLYSYVFINLDEVDEKIRAYLSTQDYVHGMRAEKYGNDVARDYLPGKTPEHVREEWIHRQDELEREFWTTQSP